MQKRPGSFPPPTACIISGLEWGRAGRLFVISWLSLSASARYNIPAQYLRDNLSLEGGRMLTGIGQVLSFLLAGKPGVSMWRFARESIGAGNKQRQNKSMCVRKDCCNIPVSFFQTTSFYLTRVESGARMIRVLTLAASSSVQWSSSISVCSQREGLFSEAEGF